jgi:hypothetical protein
VRSGRAWNQVGLQGESVRAAAMTGWCRGATCSAATVSHAAGWLDSARHGDLLLPPLYVWCLRARRAA